MSQVVRLLAVVGLVVWAVLVQGRLMNLEKTSEKEETMSVKLNSFKMCPDHMDVPSTFDNLSLYLDPGNEHTLFVDGVINVTEIIPNGTDIIIDARKCYNEREASCEKYAVHVVEDVCAFIPQKGMMWSGFADQVEGNPGACPIPVGMYTMNEAPVDLSNFQNQTEFVGHWQIEMSFAKGPKRYGCMMLDGTLSFRTGAL